MKIKQKLARAGLALAVAIPLLAADATALRVEASAIDYTVQARFARPADLVRAATPELPAQQPSGSISSQSVGSSGAGVSSQSVGAQPANATPTPASGPAGTPTPQSSTRSTAAASSGSRTGEIETEVGPDGKLVKAGSLLVTFRGNAQTSTSDAANRQAGSISVRSIGTGRSVQVQVQPGTLAQSMASYASRPDVERVEPDYIVTPSMTPNDPKYPETWGLPKIGAPAAWDTVGGAAGIRVAVLDTGILSGHPDLAGKVVASKDYTGSPYGTEDRHGHGTHVAGTIAANANNGVGVTGVAYNANLVIGKVLSDSGVGAISDVASGIVWATDNGAKVVSMSLGANSSCPSVLQDAVNYAWTHGVVMVAAAGNDGQSAVHTPANCTNVVPVGATDSNDDRPSFSNYGPNVPISAPGVFVLSTYKDGDYMWMSGTSMATPHVAGVAALVWASSYGTGSQAVVSRLFSTADQIAGTGSLWTYGRVNAARAVAGGSGAPTPTPTPSPTPAPSPTVPVACSPRPPVAVRMAQGSTAGTYKVTVTAGTATQGTNRLQQLRFGAGSNAVIDTGTQAASGGNFSINVPATPSEYTFTLKRAASGQAVTVPVTVVDSCGEWQTLIGSGTGAP